MSELWVTNGAKYTLDTIAPHISLPFSLSHLPLRQRQALNLRQTLRDSVNGRIQCASRLLWRLIDEFDGNSEGFVLHPLICEGWQALGAFYGWTLNKKFFYVSDRSFEQSQSGDWNYGVQWEEKLEHPSVTLLEHTFYGCSSKSREFDQFFTRGPWHPLENIKSF